MKDKTVVITGANAGIGYQSTLTLAQAGASVIMACRSLDKAEAAKQQILDEVPNAKLQILQLDVSSLDSVREFARQFGEKVGTLDLLINNAGIVAIPLARNRDGHEMQFATNYLGAFALTGLLLPHLRRNMPTRIVNVSSLAHRFGKLNPDDLNWETTPYNEWKSYANSKVACMSFTMELNRRLKHNGFQTRAVAAHPGFANTDIHKNSPALSKERGPIGTWFHSKMETLIPTAAEAARPILLAATGDQVQGGDYYGPGGFLEIGGKPAKAKVNPIAYDQDLGRRLWVASENLSGVHYLSDH